MAEIPQAWPPAFHLPRHTRRLQPGGWWLRPHDWAADSLNGFANCFRVNLFACGFRCFLGYHPLALAGQRWFEPQDSPGSSSSRK